MKNNAFPEGDYTPNGYIDNPFHTRNLNPSGLMKTSHRLGIGWWYPTGRIDDGDNLGAQYVSNLDLAFGVGNKTIVLREDCDQPGVSLTSKYHSKHILSYDLDIDGILISAIFYLVGEDSLLCRLELQNTSAQDRKLTVYTANYFHMVNRRWWGSDGIAGYYMAKQDAIVQTIWAYGDQFALGSDIKSSGMGFAKTETDWLEQIRSDKLANEHLSARRKEPLYGTLRYELKLSAGDSNTFCVCLARGVNSKEALTALHTGLEQASEALDDKIADDDAFWSRCPVLTGDWPSYWKHGWVYDIETQRMNSRPPSGIYKHHWDAMQVHEPRAVLGETAIDALTLSYADIALAQEELYGVFADAPYPNVPCTREDGSMNMIAADGAECGTAPSWCFPFHVIHSVYCRTRDKEWLAKLYPYLCDFINWWFENRTDLDGWFHCKCSWESGQDGSKRFLVEGHDPGAVSEYVRTVDVEASVAEALTNLAMYASELGKDKDARKWTDIASDRTQKVRKMFVDGWYRDVDSRTGRPIILKDYIDIMMMAPVTCGVATPEQITALAPKFDYFKENQRFWLEWPSFVFPFSEAACYAGHRQFIADALWEIGERMYPRLDTRRPWMAEDETERFVYRVPGVSREFWALREDPTAGIENYGWGATLPMVVIRSIFGFREDTDSSLSAFFLAPTVPSLMLQDGRSYGITNLDYRDITVDLRCKVADGGVLITELKYRSETPARLRITGEDNAEPIISEYTVNGTVILRGANGTLWRIEVD